MMTDDEIVAVVQAHKEGKRIQVRQVEGQQWKYVDEVEGYTGETRWNFWVFEYRISPEPPTEELCPCCGNPRKCEPRKPREWKVWCWGDGISSSDDTHFSGEAIRVREVIE